jgi:hypothetical protein
MNTNSTGRVHLQNVGEVAGKKVSDLKPGDKMMWNFGYTSTVVDCKQVTAKSWELRERDDKSGNEYTRRKRPDTLVACASADGKWSVLI